MSVLAGEDSKFQRFQKFWSHCRIHSLHRVLWGQVLVFSKSSFERPTVKRTQKLKFGFLSLQLLIFPLRIRSIIEANEHSVYLNGEINSVSASLILCNFPDLFSFSRLNFLAFMKNKNWHLCLVFKFFLAEQVYRKQFSFLQGKDEVLGWVKTPWLVHFVM